MPRVERRSDAAGFTLVEVLVALVVTGFLMAIILDGAVTARERHKASLEKRAAVLLARNLLTRASIEKFQRASRSGTSNGLAWELSESIEQTDRRGLFGLVRIETRVANKRGRQLLTIGTLRIKALADS